MDAQKGGEASWSGAGKQQGKRNWGEKKNKRRADEIIGEINGLGGFLENKLDQ